MEARCSVRLLLVHPMALSQVSANLVAESIADLLIMSVLPVWRNLTSFSFAVSILGVKRFVMRPVASLSLPSSSKASFICKSIGTYKPDLPASAAIFSTMALAVLPSAPSATTDMNQPRIISRASASLAFLADSTLRLSSSLSLIAA